MTLFARKEASTRCPFGLVGPAKILTGLPRRRAFTSLEKPPGCELPLVDPEHSDHWRNRDGVVHEAPSKDQEKHGPSQRAIVPFTSKEVPRRPVSSLKSLKGFRPTFAEEKSE